MKPYYIYEYDNYEIIQTPNLWESYQNYNYILKKGSDAVIFDPGDYQRISKTIEELNLNIKGIYLTHHHRDHANATEEFSQHWKCPVFGFKKDEHRLPHLTNTFDEDTILNILGLSVKIIFLPGHTLGLCAFYFSDKNWLFSSDLIFSFGCGRVFEGSFEQMFQSLKQVTQLPPQTILFSSHEYTLSNLLFLEKIFKNKIDFTQHIINTKKLLAKEIPTVPTRLDFELSNNPFLRWNDPSLRKALSLIDATDQEVFSKLRKLKDLS